jgi:hypothetical protein
MKLDDLLERQKEILKSQAQVSAEIELNSKLLKKRHQETEMAFTNIEILEGSLETEFAKDIVDLATVRTLFGAIEDNRAMLEGIREAILGVEATLEKAFQAKHRLEQLLSETQMMIGPLGKVLPFDRNRGTPQG